jgi:hypothetical protein
MLIMCRYPGHFGVAWCQHSGKHILGLDRVVITGLLCQAIYLLEQSNKPVIRNSAMMFKIVLALSIFNGLSRIHTNMDRVSVDV